MNCPQCGEKAEADFVNIGVGSQQISPYYCPNCGWAQDSPDYDSYVDEAIEFKQDEGK
jgi:sarcosine oxidase delta subunit